MASQVIPFTLDCEYRGRQAEGGEFVNDQGEKVSFGPAYKFEYDLPDGEPMVMALREGVVDQSCDFDSQTLKKGERVTITGTVSVPERGSQRNTVIRPYAIRRATGDASKLRAAS